MAANEDVRWRSFANRVLGRRSNAGGELVVTDRRMLFQPAG